MSNVSLNVVEYRRYPTPVIQYRACVLTVGNNGIINMCFEAKSWDKLFELLDKMYPGIEFDMPDEIVTLIY